MTEKRTSETPDNKTATNPEAGIAYIITVGTDMGTAGSWCDSCKTILSQSDLPSLKDIMEGKLAYCPNPKCKKQLEYGGIYVSSGGSDF